MLARRFLALLRDSYRYATFRYRYTDSRGVFDTFDRAVMSAPTDKPVGYDHAALAKHYRDELDLVSREFDYPVFFHLSAILEESSRPLTVLDFGGNIGVHYLACSNYLDLDDVFWIICDVPAITAMGKEVCKDRSNVRFINDLGELQDRTVDVVLACGSIQFCCSDFAEKFFGEAGLRARHVLITQIILQDGPQFVTLQNGGLSYYPQYIYNGPKFISSVAQHGFTVVDRWDDHSTGLSLPFHPERSVPTASGLYFEAST